MTALEVMPTFDLEGSADIAAGGVERDDPFVLARFGDGDLYCMKADTEEEAAAMLQATLGHRPGRPPLALADGELWSPKLRDMLRDAWTQITSGDHTLLLGNPRTSDFGRELYPYWDSLAGAIDRHYIPVHHEMFWLRHGPQPGLARFCLAVRRSQQRKLLVGRKELRSAAVLIHSDFVDVDPFESVNDAARVVEAAADYDLVLFCAGRGGKPMIAALLDRPRTLIDVGSLFDPILIANSRPRPGAPSDRDAELFFTSIIGSPVTVSPDRPGRAYPG